MSKTTAIEWQIHRAMQGFDWCACRACRIKFVHESWEDSEAPCGCVVCARARAKRPLRAREAPAQPWETRKAA